MVESPDPLDSLPTVDTFPTTPDEYLASLPTRITPLSELFTDYPASTGDSDGVQVSTRIPADWLEQVDSIRQLVGTMMPDIWPTRARFFRWCIQQGMRAIQTVSAELNAEGRLEQPMDDTLRARIFIEHEGGRLAARADTMNMARDQIDSIAQAVNSAIFLHEYAEAADMINAWIDGAREQSSPFWTNYMCKLLVDHELLRDALRTLVSEGMLVDEYLINLADQAGVLDIEQPA